MPKQKRKYNKPKRGEYVMQVSYPKYQPKRSEITGEALTHLCDFIKDSVGGNIGAVFTRYDND